MQLAHCALWIVLATNPRTASAGDHSKHGPVLLVGVDGMTFDILDPLITEGRLPTLARLSTRAARAVLRSERPMRSPALWTTIATGQPRRVHRIYDFVTGSSYWPKAERSGQQRLVTSDMRAAPALWQMASSGGRRSLVVGWLNTWPAEPLNGVMVAPYMALGERRQTSIKGRIYKDAAEQTYPRDKFAELRPLVVRADAIEPSQIARIVDIPERGSPLYSKIPRLRRYLYTVRWSIAAALTNTAIVRHQLLAVPDIDLVMTYFDGADTLAHRFWIMRESIPAIEKRLQAHGMDASLAPELKQRLGHAVEAYYELFDSLLADMLNAAGPEATVILVSDHGWGSSGRVRALHDSVPFDGEHRIDGVWMAAGPHIEAGRYPPLCLYDVAPTVLYLLSLGIPQAMPGRVATEMVDEDFAIKHPPIVLAEKKKAASNRKPAGEPQFEEQEIERLRSLGYVE